MCFKKKREAFEVTLCAETRLLTLPTCPSTVKVRYYQTPKPGEPVPPAEICYKHMPLPIPKVKVWAGVYDLLVATGDWQAYLTKIKAAGATGIRIFADCQWNWVGTQPFDYADYNEETAEKIRYKDPLDPKRIENRNGVMTLIRESGAEFSLYDYTKPRASYWDHLREVLAYCKEIGLQVWLVFTDYCSLKSTGDSKYFSPWYCAVQRMLPGITDGTWGPGMRGWFALYYQSLCQTLDETGVDYMVEDMNEGDVLQMSSEFMLDWFKWSNQQMKDLVKPMEKIVCTPSRNVVEIAALCGFYSPHGVGTVENIRSFSGIEPSKLIWSSDGFWQGQGAADAKGRKGLGYEEASKIGSRILQVNGVGFEYLPRGRYALNNDRADLDYQSDDEAVINALAFPE